jgi:predicted DNA-binding transcriptional regulator AlpA
MQEMSRIAEVESGKAEPPLREMVTAEQVLEMIPVSRTTLFRLERDGLFPAGQPITAHRKLWFLDEVRRWQKDLQDPDSAVAQAMRHRAKRRPGKK